MGAGAMSRLPPQVSAPRGFRTCEMRGGDPKCRELFLENGCIWGAQPGAPYTIIPQEWGPSLLVTS